MLLCESKRTEHIAASPQAHGSTTCLRFPPGEEFTKTQGGIQEVGDAVLVDSLRPVSLNHRPPQNIDNRSRFCVNTDYLNKCDHFSGALRSQGGVVTGPDRTDDLEDLPHPQVRPPGEHDGCPVEADVDQQKFIERSSSAKYKPTDSESPGATGLSLKGVWDEPPDIHRNMKFLGQRISPLFEKRPGCNDAELRSARLHNPPHLL